MYTTKILFCLAVLGLQHYWASANTSSYQPQQARSLNDNGDKQITVSSASEGSSSSASADGPLMNALYRKSRQSRCVRCYDDRYPSTDRGGYGSGYSSRAVDDRSSTSNWYYPTYDRYDDRYRTGTADYDRYYRDRDDRYGSRGYDRYDTRGSGYDRYDTRNDDRRAPVYDRYDDRRGDYGESRGSAYEPRDRYAGYGADYRDRYYDRYRGGSSGSSVGYDRDYYDRYYSRYDYRNYRPWDETYRGQSGFDNSGRGYYFAGEDDEGTRLRPSAVQSSGGASPCGVRVPNCPYDNTTPVRVSSGAIDSSYSNRGITNVYNRDDRNQNRDRSSGAANTNGWVYRNEKDNGGYHGANGQGNGSSNNNNNNNNSNTNSNSNSNQNTANSKTSQSSGSNTRNQENEQQSSTYGSRPPPRPLTVSYLFDRDSNSITKESNGSSNNAAESAAPENAANEGSGANSMMLTGDKPATAEGSAGQN